MSSSRFHETDLALGLLAAQRPSPVYLLPRPPFFASLSAPPQTSFLRRQGNFCFSEQPRFSSSLTLRLQSASPPSVYYSLCMQLPLRSLFSLEEKRVSLLFHHAKEEEARPCLLSPPSSLSGSPRFPRESRKTGVRSVLHSCSHP